MDPMVYWYTWAIILFTWIAVKLSGEGFGILNIAADTDDNTALLPNPCLDILDNVFTDVQDMYAAMSELNADFAVDSLRDTATEDLRFKLEATLSHITAVYECLEAGQ